MRVVQIATIILLLSLVSNSSCFRFLKCLICPPSPTIFSIAQCGTDGVSYHSKSCRICAGAGFAYAGPCRTPRAPAPPPPTPPPPCVCPLTYMPECGSDGNTYDNGCIRECSGVGFVSKGKCPKLQRMIVVSGRGRSGCVCYLNWDPICGTDGKTYGNDCERKCKGGIKAYYGECGDPHVCRHDRHSRVPECGVDGVTYRNACGREYLGVELAYAGECTDGSTEEEIIIDGIIS